jgi:DNA (cytosine-5)-methyltransferase 1
MVENLKLIDLFAGIGGIRLGFELASKQRYKKNCINCVFTSEWDKFAQKTYLMNFKNEIIHGDITKIDEKEIPNHDILLAGFPCQSFSQAGLKQGFNDTRGTLFFDIERIILKKKPKVIFLENVKQLRGHEKGRTLQIILNHLNLAGYKNLQYKVLRARDFGSPQNRERIYIIGFLDESIKFNFPKGSEISTKVGNILENNVDDKYTISDRLWEGHQRRKIVNKENGKGFGYGLFNKDSPYTNTMSARYYKDGSEILIEQKGENPRKITPREASRLQGFPDSYILPNDVSDMQLYKQFGNSVCVNVIKEIAKEIFISLDNSYKNENVNFYNKKNSASEYLKYSLF